MKKYLFMILVLCTVYGLPNVEEEAEVVEGHQVNVDGPRAEALVDGVTSQFGKHPWHVGLVREESKTGFLGFIRHLGGLIRTTTYCGATLINYRWLVTAAHCIKPKDRPVDIRVVMGSSKRARYFYYFFQTDSVDEIHIHPEYSTVSHNYDIALLRLKKIPELSPGELWPICLPRDPQETYSGKSATVVGWGRTQEKPGSTPRYLQELPVNIISQAQCGRQWSYGGAKVEVGGPKICYESTGASCHGDSGSGMFYHDNLRAELIGVCSYGLATCDNWAPEVYTRVTSAMDWIKETLSSDSGADNDDINIPLCGVTTETEPVVPETDRGSSTSRSWSDFYDKIKSTFRI